jgi:hypothetical protein
MRVVPGRSADGRALPLLFSGLERFERSIGLTVVGAPPYEIDFVTTRLSVFGNEQVACLVPRKPLRIPVAERVDVRTLEGIVLRHLSVSRPAQDLARQTAEVLRQRTVFRPARGDVQMPIGADCDASAVVEPTRVER